MYSTLKLRTLLLNASLVALVLLGIQENVRSETPSITSGRVDQLIGADIPQPPKGYETQKELVQAFAQKEVTPIQQATTFPDVEVRKNITYSTAAGERGMLDLYSSRNRESPGIGLVLVHGGGWKTGSKEDYQYYGQQFAHRGFTTVCINYRLVPDGRFPKQVQDVKCAIRWLRQNAKELGVDPERIAVMGGSAGGHLSLLAAYAENVEEFENVGGCADVSSSVQAVIDIYGPTDLAADFDDGNDMVPGLIRDFLGENSDEVSRNMKRASPVTYVHAQSPATLIIHGTIDDIVPVAQGDRLAARLEELQVPYVYDRLPGWPHAMDVAQPVNDRVLFLVERFLNNTLGKR